jgi:hypothetical protein
MMKELLLLIAHTSWSRDIIVVRHIVIIIVFLSIVRDINIIIGVLVSSKLL